jgi:hypothetical protein
MVTWITCYLYSHTNSQSKHPLSKRKMKQNAKLQSQTTAKHEGDVFFHLRKNILTSGIFKSMLMCQAQSIYTRNIVRIYDN